MKISFKNKTPPKPMACGGLGIIHHTTPPLPLQISGKYVFDHSFCLVVLFTMPGRRFQTFFQALNIPGTVVLWTAALLGAAQSCSTRACTNTQITSYRCTTRYYCCTCYTGSTAVRGFHVTTQETQRNDSECSTAVAPASATAAVMTSRATRATGKGYCCSSSPQA